MRPRLNMSIMVLAALIAAALLIRPPDIVVGGLIFYQGFFIHSFFILSFFLSFFALWYPSSPNGTKPYPATWSEVSVIWKCISEIPSPKNHLFQRFRNLRANLTVYIYGSKYDTHKRASYKEFATSFDNDMNFGPHMASNWTVVFTRLPKNLAFYFIARLRRRRSANGTQPHFVKRSTVSRANNVP